MREKGSSLIHAASKNEPQITGGVSRTAFPLLFQVEIPSPSHFPAPAPPPCLDPPPGFEGLSLARRLGCGSRAAPPAAFRSAGRRSSSCRRTGPSPAALTPRPAGQGSGGCGGCTGLAAGAPRSSREAGVIGSETSCQEDFPRGRMAGKAFRTDSWRRVSKSRKELKV